MENEYTRIKYRGKKFYIKYIDYNVESIYSVIVKIRNLNIIFINRGMESRFKFKELHLAIKFIMASKWSTRTQLGVIKYSKEKFFVNKINIGGSL